jgi:S-sulfo-L-cysteine synthase (O-acetyl-L-serine-dependent)
MTWKTKTDSYPEVHETEIERRVRDSSTLFGNIGNTPLLRIRNIAIPNDYVEIYAKAEWFNPGGSIKDRPVLNMLLEAEKSGKLTKGKIIIDATSGNTGIAYAMIGSALGYKVMLALPANASPERKQTLRAYGAEILETSPLAGTDGAQQHVKEIVVAHPDQFFYPDQYNNPSNWRAHYNTTAWEIWNQSRKLVTHFVAGLGTTGTFIGISRRLKDIDSSIKCISFGPDSPLHGLEGLKHLPTALVPGIYDPTLADEHLTVSTEESYAMVRQLARQEGLFAGISSGAALAVSLKLATQIESGVIVTIFPDGGARYSSEHFWNEGV